MFAKKTNSNIQWYIEILDSRTNDIFAQEIAENCSESESRSVLCSDGQKRNLWNCPWSLVDQAIRNLSVLSLNIKIWRKKGNNCIVEEVPFLLERPKKRHFKSTKTCMVS